MPVDRELPSQEASDLLALTRELADFSQHSLLDFFSLMTNYDDYRARIQSLSGPDNVRDQR